MRIIAWIVSGFGAGLLASLSAAPTAGRLPL
jgi:hypothetical protein